MKTRFLTVYAIFFFWTNNELIPAVPASASEPDLPNIIVMLVDDMGVMDTSVPFLVDAQGQAIRYPLNDYYRTPNMQRLADRGIRFNNFCAMSVCSPTRISIMTGQNSARHRTTYWINPDRNNAGPNGPKEWNWGGLTKSNTTLARLLRASGYRTIHVGKGHFGPRGSEGEDPLNLGFDVNVGGAAIGQPGSYYGSQDYGNKPNQQKTKAQVTHGVPGLEKYHGLDTFLTEALTLEARSHMSDAVAEGKPFFLYFPQYAVHAPFNSDPRFASHYESSGQSRQAQAFATLIEGMDKSLGDLMDHLQTLNVARNTLIIFLGDNGSDAPLGEAHEVACAAPLRGKKGSHYEGGMRVPFIAAWAEPSDDSAIQKSLPIARGKIQTQIAAVYDIFPTLLELTGTASPDRYPVDGASLKTLLGGSSDDAREKSFLMHCPHAPHRTDYFTCYRDGDWKVIYHYLPTAVSDGSHYQLFNLARDPFEQTDLASSERAVLIEMITAMKSRLQKQGALYPESSDGEVLEPIVPEGG
ncbi:MAG: sulfatase-like hydrolase/transferase [Planctomycetota bacterium]